VLILKLLQDSFDQAKLQPHQVGDFAAREIATEIQVFQNQLFDKGSIQPGTPQRLRHGCHRRRIRSRAPDVVVKGAYRRIPMERVFSSIQALFDRQFAHDSTASSDSSASRDFFRVDTYKPPPA